MSTNRDFDRIASGWLAGGPTELNDRVLEAALDEVRVTQQRRRAAVTWRTPHMSAPLRLAAAIAAALVGGGAIWYAGLNTNPSLPALTQSPVPSFTSAPTALPSAQTARPSPSVSEPTVWGWPSTIGAGPGLYSWDGDRCAGQFCGASARGAFMHNCYGSCDAAITIEVLADKPVADGWRDVTIAGHSGWYRRLVEPDPTVALFEMQGYEEWVADIDGVMVGISLDTKTGASDAALADAHAIIDSMRSGPSSLNPHGFRLVFRLTNYAWDSG
jgi:hypothetical protein